MGFKCGLVGLPNVGKSTIFNALTCAGAEAANFPFCTKDPNVGMVNIPDNRLQKLAEVHKPQKVIPAVMQFVDIAGLVKGASQGEGLGNQFLSHIRETDAIMHVVRCFEDVDVTHVDGDIDPVRDVETIHMELVLRDMESISKKLEREKKLAASGNKESKIIAAVLDKLAVAFDAGKAARTVGLEEDELELVKDMNLLTLKPMFYCANVREDEIDGSSPLVGSLRKVAEDQGCELVIISGKIESELSELPEEEKQPFLDEMGLEESGLNQVIALGFKLLGLHTYFTAGEKEVRAWTIPLEAKAPQAAGVIHTDFEKGFIRAETLGWADFEREGDWNTAKGKGLVRTEGKEYVVQNGDIMHFLFNV